VYEGLAIYDLILNSEGHTKVIVEGMAASMGGVIALAGDEIEMNDNAFFMMHAVTAGCFGNKNDFKNGIQQIENCEERLGKIFGERTKADEKTIKNWFDSGQDHWLSSDKCLELGICDRVIKPTKKEKLGRKPKTSQTKLRKKPLNALTCILNLLRTIILINILK
jgi:ATP-dependent protease ClpP protease subunit